MSLEASQYGPPPHSVPGVQEPVGEGEDYGVLWEGHALLKIISTIPFLGDLVAEGPIQSLRGKREAAEEKKLAHREIAVLTQIRDYMVIDVVRNIFSMAVLIALVISQVIYPIFLVGIFFFAYECRADAEKIRGVVKKIDLLQYQKV